MIHNKLLLFSFLFVKCFSIKKGLKILNQIKGLWIIMSIIVLETLHSVDNLEAFSWVIKSRIWSSSDYVKQKQKKDQTIYCNSQRKFVWFLCLLIWPYLTISFCSLNNQGKHAKKILNWTCIKFQISLIMDCTHRLVTSKFFNNNKGSEILKQTICLKVSDFLSEF